MNRKAKLESLIAEMVESLILHSGTTLYEDGDGSLCLEISTWKAHSQEAELQNFRAVERLLSCARQDYVVQTNGDGDGYDGNRVVIYKLAP